MRTCLIVICAILSGACAAGWKHSAHCGGALEPAGNYGPDHRHAPCDPSSVEFNGYCWFETLGASPCAGGAIAHAGKCYGAEAKPFTGKCIESP